MTIFTKVGCEKCEYVKKSVDLKKLGVKEEVLSPNNYESLALLAWHELVNVAQTQLPILILDDSSSLIGAIRIKNFLEQQTRPRTGTRQERGSTKRVI